MDREYLPLSDIHSDRLKLGLNLPFGLETKIGFSQKKFLALMQVGGIRQVTIVNDTFRQTSRAQMMIVGVDKSGVGVAGAGIINEIPLSTASSIDNNCNYYSKNQWTDVTILVNNEEIKRRILGSDKDVRKDENWTPFLNFAVINTIREAGNSRMKDIAIVDKIQWLVFGAVSLGVGLKIMDPGLNALSTSILYMWTVTCDQVFNIKTFGPEAPGRGYRFSILPGGEYDRLLLFNFLTMKCKNSLFR